jgi:hypothetical protein
MEETEGQRSTEEYVEVQLEVRESLALNRASLSLRLSLSLP